MFCYMPCRYFILVYLTTVLAYIQFKWLPDDDRFDCVVGITVDGRPVGIGTLLNANFLITSANPLEMFLETRNKKNQNNKYDKYFDTKNRIKFHAIHNQYNESKFLDVAAINGNIADRNAVWIRMGFNRGRRHSPIHDLLAVSIKGEVKRPPASNREAFYLASDFNSYFTSGWTFAGFGYLDWFHIADNRDLEMSVYEDSDVVDCDEWIPRPWGRFVCLFNVENLVGIQSGAPLFYQGALRGVGCFILQKGNESILVFTDYSVYAFDSTQNSKGIYIGTS